MQSKSLSHLPWQRVSPREKEVLELVSNGHSSVEIATKLHLSTYTVNDHRKMLMSKLAAKNVAQLVRRGFEFQLLNQPSRPSL